VKDTYPFGVENTAEDKIRSGYSYFPQSRSVQDMGRGLLLPEVKAASSGPSYLVPLRATQVDVSKSMVVDLVHDLDSPAAAPHRDNGIAGLNALFGDGHVQFQSARRNPAAFDRTLWANIGNDGLSYRQAMNMWKP
jgi:prepilin-type processing-associated H-X9-DG protein